MLDGRDESFFGVVEVLGVAGHVLDGLGLCAHHSGAVGGAVAAAAVDPVADGVAIACLVASAVGVVVGALPAG